jgi:hypothetical protein
MRSVLRIAVYIAAFIAGCMLATMMAVMFFKPELASDAGGLLHDPIAMVACWALATVLVLCPVWLAMRWLIAHRHAREISYVTESGKVSVSLVAIEEALTRAVENENCIKKAAVRLYEDRVKRQVIIETVVTLWETPNITERTRACQQLLRRRFAELMPEQSAVQVYFTVARVQQQRREERKAAPEAIAAATPQAVPATAPEQLSDIPSGDTIGLRSDSSVSTDSALAPESDLADPYNGALGSEDDLYVGPSYPVESDDDDSGEQAPLRRDSAAAKKN